MRAKPASRAMVFVDPVHQRRHDQFAHDKRKREEQHQLAHGQQRAAALCSTHAQHHTQHENAQHVVDDRRAQNDQAFFALQTPELSQRLHGNADAGGGQSHADEQAGLHAQPKGQAHGHAADHRRDDAGDGGGGRCFAHLAKRRQVRLQAGDKHQQQHADAGNRVEGLAFGHQAQQRWPQHQAGHQLAQYGRQAQSLAQPSHQACPDQDERQRQQELDVCHENLLRYGERRFRTPSACREAPFMLPLRRF